MKSLEAIYALLETADPIVDVEALDGSALVARVEAELGFTPEDGSRPAGDIVAGRPVIRDVRVWRQRWVLRPVWAAVAAFAATVVVLGGSLALGVRVHQQGLDTSSAWIPEALVEVVATTSGWWQLIPAIALVVAVAAALVVRNQKVRAGKERAMATTIETTPAEGLETAKRNNRWLVVTVIVLAVALVALGAWVVYDLASEPETAATEDINALYDDYLAAWSAGDSEAFADLTTVGYTWNGSGVTRTQAEEAAVMASVGGLQVVRIGDLVVLGAGPYYVAVAERITFGGNDYVGISSYRVVETDEGLKVAEHNWVGNL